MKEMDNVVTGAGARRTITPRRAACQAVDTGDAELLPLFGP
jgi:hypothetical protein